MSEESWAELRSPSSSWSVWRMQVGPLRWPPKCLRASTIRQEHMARVCARVCLVYRFESKIGHFDFNISIKAKAGCSICVCLSLSLCMCLYTDVCRGDLTSPWRQISITWGPGWGLSLRYIMLIKAIITVITLSLLTAQLSVSPLSKFMFYFMHSMNVFTVRTLFSG